MERIEFLRDIENEEKYGMACELAYLHVFNALSLFEKKMHNESAELQLLDCHDPFQTRCREMLHILRTMSQVMRDMADRRKRLFDIAAGLSDVVFDEESTEKELGP